jgi:hypothetical protein
VAHGGALTFRYATHSIFSSTCGAVSLYLRPHYTPHRRK